jgi:hypothetical protein
MNTSRLSRLETNPACKPVSDSHQFAPVKVDEIIMQKQLDDVKSSFHGMVSSAGKGMPSLMMKVDWDKPVRNPLGPRTTPWLQNR